MGRRRGSGSNAGDSILVSIIALIVVACIAPALLIIAGILLIVLIIMAIVTYIQKKNQEKEYMEVFNNVSECLKEIDTMTGQEFELLLIKYVLPANGYKKINGTSYSGDYGVDIVAYKDNVKYAIQCKRFNGSVSNKAIQEVVAGKNHYGCSKSMVITNSDFTKNAIQLAHDNDVELVNRNELMILLNNSKPLQKKEEKKNND